jgi:tight adherence protein B
LILFLAWFFYRSLFAAVFLIPLVIPYSRYRRRAKTDRRRERLTGQFKEALGSMLTSLRAGLSAENSVRETWKEMEFLYGGKSEICRELWKICQGMDSRIPLEELMMTFGEDSGIEVIREFAGTFAIAKRSGGNMAEIMNRTIQLLQDRVDVEKEISVLISARKLEQHIMDAAPFLIVGYIGITSKGFFEPLYHNAAGIAVMTACLIVYCAAYLLSEKITDIPV